MELCHLSAYTASLPGLNKKCSVLCIRVHNSPKAGTERVCFGFGFLSFFLFCFSKCEVRLWKQKCTQLQVLRKNNNEETLGLSHNGVFPAFLTSPLSLSLSTHLCSTVSIRVNLQTWTPGGVLSRTVTCTLIQDNRSKSSSPVDWL